MYHPAIIDRRLSKLASEIRLTVDPGFNYTDYPKGHIESVCAKLAKVFNPLDGSVSRPLTIEEESFIRGEITRCKADFHYWLQNYAVIKSKNAELVKVRPTHVQKLFLDRVAAGEYAAYAEKSGDGILLAALKARQLGCSTISELIIAHRTIFYGSIAALIASDADDHTINLYEMVARILDNLPWFMVPRSLDPKRDYRAKNQLISFYDQDSIIRFGSGKNMQGGKDQEKGSIGTGQTLHLVHLSEFAIWSNPEQIFDSLMPAVPMSPKTFMVIESTAKGRGNEWHRTWERAKAGYGRFKPMFFPYYTDPNDYRRPAPTNWSPAEHTQRHAARVYATSPQYLGHHYELTREQMFWYEQEFAQYKHSKMLHKFLAEYAADDVECFQASTQGVFPGELMHELRQGMTTNPIYVEIRPKMYIEAGQ